MPNALDLLSTVTLHQARDNVREVVAASGTDYDVLVAPSMKLLQLLWSPEIARLTVVRSFISELARRKVDKPTMLVFMAASADFVDAGSN